MKIAVIGCGAIGGLFLGYLTQQNQDVTGLVKDYQKQALLKYGLVVEGVKGNFVFHPRTETALKEKVDLAIFATKINDLEKLVKDNLDYLKDAVVLTTQNGVRADYILEEYFPNEKIITGIVMFGATFYPPNKIVHNFNGDLILGNIFSAEPETLEEVKSVLSRAFNTAIDPNIKGAKYLKVFLNLNNCIPAVLGLSMQECFADLEIAQLAIKLNKEAFDIVGKSNISLESLPTYPKERLQGLVSMDINQAAALFSKIMTNLSKEPLYGSILQSIQRGKKSEIDYINGEIVRLACENNLKAPLNEKIVELVHKVEDEKDFFPKEELLKQFNN